MVSVWAPRLVLAVVDPSPNQVLSAQHRWSSDVIAVTGSSRGEARPLSRTPPGNGVEPGARRRTADVRRYQLIPLGRTQDSRRLPTQSAAVSACLPTRPTGCLSLL